MSDQPGGSPPPPPPPGTPPPAYQPLPNQPPPGYPPAPGYQPAPAYQPPPGYQQPPPGYQPAPGYAGQPGYVPPSAGYAPVVYGAAGIGLMSQFRGVAMWSIILGLVSVGVPIVTGITTGGTVTFFYVLPIIGAIRGFQAIGRGQLIGGVAGIVLNCIGGLISLLASGVLFR